MINNIIKQANQGIVLEETPVILSDEKLQSILLHTYEKAVCNATEWHWYNLYGILLSISGTLLLTIFTSTYNEIGPFKATDIKMFVIVLTIVTAILGFIFLGVSVNKKTKNDTETRDSSIKEIMDKYYLQNK